MESLLTIPVRCTIMLSIAALIGTSCLRLMKHLDAPPGQILAAKVIKQAPDEQQEHTAESFRNLPGELFIPFVMAALLLFSWQALDFSKPRKQSNLNNLPHHLGSRKPPASPGRRR